MRTLEIVTSQNVAIDYNLANIGERGVAFIMDVIFMAVLIFLLSIVQSLVVPNQYFEVVAYRLLGGRRMSFQYCVNRDNEFIGRSPKSFSVPGGAAATAAVRYNYQQAPVCGLAIGLGNVSQQSL